MAAAAHGYMAYAGRYEIVSLDPETGDVTVRHSMNVSMNPTWLGQSQERNAHGSFWRRGCAMCRLPWVEGAKRSAAILGAKGAVLCSFLVAKHARRNNDNEGNDDAADKRRPR